MCEIEGETMECLVGETVTEMGDCATEEMG